MRVMSQTRKNLWAPWRIDYMQSLVDSEPAEHPGRCFLCEAAEADATDARRAERLVLHRDAHGTLLLNRYPYTNGHLLVAPHPHVAELSDLDAAARAGLMELSELGCRLLKRVVNPQGFNVGANVGRAAGAGVPGHLHLHIVPRWAGDTNFMDVVGGARVIPQALETSYEALRAGMAGL